MIVYCKKHIYMFFFIFFHELAIWLRTIKTTSFSAAGVNGLGNHAYVAGISRSAETFSSERRVHSIAMHGATNVIIRLLLYDYRLDTNYRNVDYTLLIITSGIFRFRIMFPTDAPGDWLLALANGQDSAAEAVKVRLMFLAFFWRGTV